MESDPTPEEIAEACLRIQATWSAAEKRRRWCYGQFDGWTIPVCQPSRKAAFLYEQSDAQVLDNYSPCGGD